jgi:hypothetical protein
MAGIRLIDMYGRQIQQEYRPVSRGLNSMTLGGLGSLAGSIYVLQIQYGSLEITRLVMKSR